MNVYTKAYYEGSVAAMQSAIAHCDVSIRYASPEGRVALQWLRLELQESLEMLQSCQRGESKDVIRRRYGFVA